MDAVKARMKTPDGTQIVHPITTAEQVDGLDNAINSAIEGASSVVYVSGKATFFDRPDVFSSNKTTITIPAGTAFRVGDRSYVLTSDRTIDVGSTVSAANRAGKDVYLYGVTNPDTTSTEPVFVISMNSTVPTGYDSNNSRKLGGFHCLCVAVGSISNHPLSGYVAGDILPASRWDLKHRPVSEPEGMVYDEQINRWVDIYLVSYSEGELVSVYGGVTADGASTPKFHPMKFGQYLGQVKKFMPNLYEFMSFSHGSNQGTNINGSADANTTGGHTDTGGRRMISDIGCEDCCGFLDQWSRDRGGPYGAASWTNDYDANDDADIKGSGYNMPNCELLGGHWNNSSDCGSRFSIWSNGPLYLSASNGARGLAEPRVPVDE